MTQQPTLLNLTGPAFLLETVKLLIEHDRLVLLSCVSTFSPLLASVFLSELSSLAGSRFATFLTAQVGQPANFD